MSESEPDRLDSVDAEDVSKGELIETIRGQQARIEHLEDELDDLREQVQSVQAGSVTRTGFNVLLDTLVGGGIDDFTSDPMTHRELVEDFNDRITTTENTVKRLASDDGGNETNRKENAWKQVVEYAQNVQNQPNHHLPENRVGIYKDDIVAATGYSKRRAQQLIEEWGEEKNGTDWRPYKQLTTSRQTASSNYQRKQLKIDLDVWGDDDA